MFLLQTFTFFLSISVGCQSFRRRSLCAFSAMSLVASTLWKALYIVLVVPHENEIIVHPYLLVRPWMVFKAMTVVGAMPPKLKLQSLICHEPAFRSFSSSTLMPVFTMAISSSRLRACLKAKTYSCCKNKHYLITLLKGQYIISLDNLSIIYQSGHRTQFFRSKTLQVIKSLRSFIITEKKPCMPL